MKKLHTYTRIFLSLLLILVTNVVMGQEINIPIKTVTADPATMTKTTGHDGDGHQSHAIGNIIDGNSETTWIADQDKEYKMLNYLQLTDVDKTGASRSWIEIPYVPNQNTAVEVTFENTDGVFGNDMPIQYIFGCGNPGSGSGMAMRINPNGIMVNLTSNQTYEDGRNSQLKSKLTYILSTAGIQEGEGDANPSMLYGFSGGDVIKECTDASKQKSLCFFDNPGDENSMTYAGRIYSVKIRENGMLRFDLQPATYNGTPGFYDRISTNFYSLTNKLPYIENTSNDAHVKIPLIPESSAGFDWSKSLVKNGFFQSDEKGSSFGFSNLDESQSGIVKVTGTNGVENGTRALKVVCPAKGDKNNAYDRQLFIDLAEPLLPGDQYYVSFYCKSDRNISIQNEAHNQGQGYIAYNVLGNINFTTEWQLFEKTGTITDSQSSDAKPFNRITLDLNVLDTENTYYITNVVVKKQVPTISAPSAGKRWSDNLVYNGMLEDDNMSSFSQNRCTLSVQDNELKVVSTERPSDNTDGWYSQFFIKLSEKVLPNEIVYISFDYKAKEETTAYTQSFQNGKGSNSSLLGTLTFATNWKTYSNKITISANQGQNGGLEYIAFNLNDKATSNDFYFRNIVVRKETTLDPGKKWSENLVNTTDIDSYTVSGSYTENGETTNVSRTLSNGIVEVVSVKQTNNDWDSQFSIKLQEPLNSEDKYYISISYSTTSTSNDVKTNSYLQSDGYQSSNLGQLTYGTDWRSKVWTGTIDKDKTVDKLTFHLNVYDDAATYRFKDIVIRKQVDADPAPTEPALDEGMKWSKSLVKNGSFTSDDLTSYSFYPNGTGDNATTHSFVSGIDGGRALEVVSKPGKTDYWQSNFTLKLSEPINKGEKFYISLDYKANRDNASLSQAYDKVNGGSVSNDRTLLTASQQWQNYTQNVEYAYEDATDKIVFYLNGDNTNTTFDFANIVVKKMVPIEEEAPVIELTIKFKNLYTGGTESYSVRHLFSLGTHEDQVLALNTRYGRYHYVSGGLSQDTNVSIDGTEHTATFRAGECAIDGTTYNVSGVPAWNNADALYLMGTHCGPVVSHNGYAPRSFYGQIYSATLTENGFTRFELVPILKDGEYGFYDNLSKIIYKKDGCAPADANLAGPEFGGYDENAVQTGTYNFKMPFKIDFTIEQRVASSLTLTTAGRENGENQEPYNNPRRLVLYGSNDGNLWQRLNLTNPNGSVVDNSDGFVDLPGKKEDSKLLPDTYRFGIVGNTNMFTQYRLIVENVRQANATHSCLRLADIALSAAYSLEHYHGRVYDSSNIPNDLIYTSEWKTSEDDSRLNSGVTIQRTHEYEHVIYVWPGKTINLTPFSDFADNNWAGFCYREQYIRWYDYKTDTRSDNLSFDAFEGRNVNVLNEGHFAWNLRDNGSGRRTREGAVAKYTAPTSNDEIFGVIAIEAAMEFDFSERTSWDPAKNVYVINEPTVQWRHTFVIKNAKTRADNMSQYINDNKITLMCPEGTPFQYPLPSFEYAESKTGHPTDFYTTDGKAIDHYWIETTKGSDTKSTYLEFDSNGNAVSDGNKNTQVVYTSGSLADNETAYSYKAKDGYNRVFYMLKPQVGTYTIKIYELTLNPEDNTPTPGMQLMEYDLKVLPPTEGNKLLTRDELTELAASNPEYKKQIPSEMEKLYVAPTAYVNFDDVNDDEVETVLRDELHKPVVLNSDQEAGGEYHYYKWPWQWENSSYGFGYEDRGDYNMYMVADHMAVTPNRGINKENDTYDDLTTANVFDVSYYETREEGYKGEKKQGYFFYANAASDPSRMAVLNIGKDFCPNTKVFVSAWVNEVQHKNLYAETANVIFSFRGVRADGTEKLLNSYVTGYVTGGWNTPSGYIAKTAENETDGVHHRDGKDLDPLDSSKELVNPEHRGDWMHVYYTFSTTHTEDFDHYIITLENNCTSSEGADYAIDDIRAYVLKPNLQARLMEPVCNAQDGTQLEIYSDFEQLKAAFAFDENTTGPVRIKYCFLDKEEFDKTYDGNTSESAVAAFNSSLQKGVYGGNKEQEYGILTLEPTYDSNILYSNYDSFVPTDDNPDYTSYYYGHRQEAGGIVIFPCKATDVMIQPGKAYILAVASEYLDFDIGGKCSKTSEFTIPLPTRIKIDGVPQSALSGASYCANQRPEVTIDMNGVRKGGEPIVDGDVKFDWYYGPLQLGEDQRQQGYTRSFKTEKIENTDDSYNEETPDLYLWTALSCLRQEYPDATEEDVKDMTPSAAKGDLKANMIEYVQKMVEEGRLTLYKDKALASAHLFGDNIHPANQKEFYMTALPIDPEEENVDFCLAPINVAIKINELTPGMKDGSEDVSYPTTMQDVPLRIGLKQLKRAVIGNLSENTVAQLENGTPVNQLWVPLRAIAPVTEEGHVAGTTLIKSDDDMIYLVDSNDPQVRIDGAGAIPVEEAAAPLKGAMIAGQSYVMGKLMEIAAVKGASANVCQLAFLENFKFREGYWYTIKFHFKQEGASKVVCPGDLVFTIKVVPEYQMWTGAVSRNWNDDRNWRRVTKDELLWTDAKDDSFLTANADYITDGETNDNTSSFAPADFTKVIIPADAPRVPYMYNLREATNKTSVQFTGARAATNQLATAKPSEAILSEVIAPNLYNLTSLDLRDQTFVIADESGMNTLGVRTSSQDAFVVKNDGYTEDMFVYAKFAKAEGTGVDGDVYTIQLYNKAGQYHTIYGGQGYLNFQPTGGNVVFAIGLKDQYGQDAKNHALWRVTQVGDGVTIRNVGRGDYLNPSEAKPSSTPVVCKLARSFSNAGAGQICYLPTLVQYDMASVEKETTKDGDVACRPWYDHTCDQIHFNSGAAMMDQRYLYYNKAWCDIEVPVGTWQTVASPLMNIVAGDLYLPTASARQDTPLFEDITYQTSLNDRFKPAVFQHSWNKSMAKVYELGGGQRNVGIKLDWSHVYNDVNVRYGAGQGFSIKVDVSAMDEANQPGKGTNPATAKFRFPKADTQYTYYNPNNTDGDRKTETVDDGNLTADGAQISYGPNSNNKRPGRLADLISSGNFSQMVGDNDNGATATQYFLVGNPLMCWLNMQKFFAKNPQFEPKYWTVTADGQRTALFTEENWVSTSQENPQFLPPGVSFFVHLSQRQDGQTGSGYITSTTVQPVFDNTMMSYTQAEPRQNGNDYDRSNNAKTRSTNATMPQLHMTATDVSGRQSRALLMDGTLIQHEGVETLFDSNLKDDAMLYTTKDGMAKTIASIAPGDTLPLAISGARDEVKLRIEGVKDFDFDLFLIDSEEGTVEPLEDDVLLKQAASGVRYYIATRSKDDTDVKTSVNVPRVTARDGYITVYAPAACEIETSAIYNTGGIRLDSAEHITESHSVKLLPGIYIVNMLCDGKTYTYKLMLR